MGCCMKRIVTLFLLIIFIFIWILTAHSFKIDGLDSGVEWDGASAYTLIDGESNCGVNFGLVKVKFDHDTAALLLCFHFIDPNMERGNQNSGITISVENSSEFEIVASDVILSENIPPYSFDGAIGVYEFNGATCELRVGFKSGLPKTIDCKVRFIDSDGYYSNYYEFTVENEEYSVPESNLMSPTADNTDSAFNPDVDKIITSKKKTTTKKSTTKRETTTKKATDKVTEKTQDEFEIKTSPPYSYTGRKTTKRVKTEKPTTVNTSKSKTTKKETVKVYYYEKEVYISEVYITEPVKTTEVTVTELTGNSETTSEYSVNNIENIEASDEGDTLSKGSKYKKITSGVALAAFVLLAVFGAYSAKKNSNQNVEDNRNTEEK